MIEINNGDRVEVSLSDYTGLAGFVQDGDSASLSYRSTKPKGPSAGMQISIAGAQWEIVAVRRSDFVADFRVLTIKRVEV